MRAALGLSIALIASGCARAAVERFDDVPRPQRAPEEVQVLLEKPDEPYTVIAVVEAKTDAVFESFEELSQTLVAEAAKLGGDAVILGTEEKESNVLFISPTNQIVMDQKKLRCEVIVFEKLTGSS